MIRSVERLSATEGRALIHCSIGKDRTGLLAAFGRKFWH